MIKKKKFEMPTALTIVGIFLLVVAIMTWFVPTSVVTINDVGERVIHYNSAFSGDGSIIENVGTNPAGIWDIFLAPIRGFIDSSDVTIAILVSGGLLAILNYVGALDAGISKLLDKYSGSTLIVLLMLVFALMGTVYGSWEELPAYAIIIIPLFVKAGYDVMTGTMVIILGATIGNMASVVNPYSVGAAVAAIGNPELSLGSGILLRLILFVSMFALGTFLLLRYANKIKKDPSASCVAGCKNIKTVIGGNDSGSVEKLEYTKPRKWSIIVFGITILFCVAGYIPWDAIPMGEGKTAFDVINALQYKMQGTFIGNFLGMNSYTEYGWWYFNEFSAMWFIGSMIIAKINKLSEKEYVREFTRGASELVGVVFVLAMSRGIALLMGTRTAGMSITFIYWLQELITSVPVWAFALAAVGIYMIIGIFLQSTSGVSGITMPIFGAVAVALFAATSLGSVGGQIILISSFTVGLNFMCGIYPGATQMGILDMTNAPFDVYLKLMLKLLLPVLLLAIVIISIAPYLGLI